MTGEAAKIDPKDAELMQGGPGLEAEKGAEGESAPSTKKVKLAGKEFEVAPELAEAIEGYRREINERDGRRGSELQGLRDQLKRLEDTVTARRTAPDDDKSKGPQPPDPKLMFEDPARYQAENLAYVQALVEQREKALVDRYEGDKKQATEATERQRVFDKRLSQFYGENPELVGKEDLVDMIWHSRFDEIRNLSLDDGFKRLAEMVRERIAQYAGSVRQKGGEGDEAPGKGAPKLEGSRPRPLAGEERKPADKSFSLSALIQRKQRRLRGEKPAEK